MKRMRTIQQWNSSTIDPPDTSHMKVIDLHSKHRQFVHNSFHDFLCPKPADEVIEKIKDYRRNKMNKKSHQMQMDKNDKCIVVGIGGLKGE